MSATKPNRTGIPLKALPSWWLTVFKWAVFLGALAYLYNNVFLTGKWEAVKHQFISIEFGARQWVLLGLACFLMFFNWGIESGKWLILMRKLQRISYGKSVVAVLAGNAISLWMPNRAGEYIGRAVLLRPRARVRGILATLIGGIAQLMITLIMGMLGFVYYAHSHWSGAPYFFAVLWVLVIAFTLLLLIPYFGLNRVRYILGRQGWQLKIRRYLAVYSIYTRNDLAAVLCLSLIRYLVFSIQLFLLLLFFAVPVEPLTVLPSIFLIFLVQTVVPTTALSELAVRGAASLSFLSVSDQYNGAVLAASYSIWLLNIILPSMAGAVVLLFIRFSRASKRSS